MPRRDPRPRPLNSSGLEFRVRHGVGVWRRGRANFRFMTRSAAQSDTSHISSADGARHGYARHAMGMDHCSRECSAHPARDCRHRARRVWWARGHRSTFSLQQQRPNGKNAPVHITPAEDTLDALQASLQLVANVDVTWSSLTPTIVAVDADGGVLSVAPGTGLVQALGTGGRKADTARVVVRQVPAALHVSPDTLHLYPITAGSLRATRSLPWPRMPTDIPSPMRS